MQPTKAKKAQLAQQQAKAAKAARRQAKAAARAHASDSTSPVLLIDLDSLQVGWHAAPALLVEALELAGPDALAFAAGNPGMMRQAVYDTCAELGITVLAAENTKNAADDALLAKARELRARDRRYTVLSHDADLAPVARHGTLHVLYLNPRILGPALRAAATTSRRLLAPPS